MSYLEDLNKKIVEEYKSGNQEKRVFLQTLKAALQKKAIDSKNTYDEKAEISTLKNELKQLNDSLDEQKSANRMDLAEQTQKQIEILNEILPEQLSDENIAKTVTDVYNQTDDKSFGSIMKQSIAALGDKADGSRIAKAVKDVIDQNA